MALPFVARAAAQPGDWMPMMDAVPDGARAAARILLLDADGCVLLLYAEDAPNGHRFWVTPGGGLQPGESFEQAARRELYEETGLDLPVGPWVWTRRHVYEWEGRPCAVYERFFVARLDSPCRIRPVAQDSYVIDYRWWSADTIRSSGDDFAPRRLGGLLADIVGSGFPEWPIDCGV